MKACTFSTILGCNGLWTVDQVIPGKPHLAWRSLGKATSPAWLRTTDTFAECQILGTRPSPPGNTLPPVENSPEPAQARPNESPPSPHPGTCSVLCHLSQLSHLAEVYLFVSSHLPRQLSTLMSSSREGPFPLAGVGVPM